MASESDPFSPFFGFQELLVLSNRQVALVFDSYEVFWGFCFFQCRGFKVDCARSCVFRKRLGIPPFGKSYLGRLEGMIA